MGVVGGVVGVLGGVGVFGERQEVSEVRWDMSECVGECYGVLECVECGVCRRVAE